MLPYTRTVTATSESSFGANSWLVDEMYEQYRDDPDSVSPAWQEFFEGYRGRADAVAPMPPAPGPDRSRHRQRRHRRARRPP